MEKYLVFPNFRNNVYKDYGYEELLNLFCESNEYFASYKGVTPKRATILSREFAFANCEDGVAETEKFIADIADVMFLLICEKCDTNVIENIKNKIQLFEQGTLANELTSEDKIFIKQDIERIKKHF